MQIQEKALRKVILAMCAVQLFNAAMDFIVWFAFAYMVPSWTIGALSLFYIILILAWSQK